MSFTSTFCLSIRGSKSSSCECWTFSTNITRCLASSFSWSDRGTAVSCRYCIVSLGTVCVFSTMFQFTGLTRTWFLYLSVRVSHIARHKHPFRGRAHVRGWVTMSSCHKDRYTAVTWARSSSATGTTSYDVAVGKCHAHAGCHNMSNGGSSRAFRFGYRE